MDEGVATQVTRQEFEALKAQVAEDLILSQDTNKLLHRMLKVGRIAFVAKVVIWIIVLGLPILLYPYIAPAFQHLTGFGTGTSTSLFGYPSPSEIQNFLHPTK